MRRILAALLLCLAFAPGIAGDAEDALAGYQTKYTKKAYISDREKIIKGLEASAKPEAVKALVYCDGISRDALEDAKKDNEKLGLKLSAAQEKLVEWMRLVAEDLKKQGKPPPDSKFAWPQAPEFKAVEQAQADVSQQQKVIDAESRLLSMILDSWGSLVGKLTPDAQKAVQADLTKGPLASKDWAVRSEAWERIGRAKTDWATDMLLAAVAAEPDPRVLCVVIDGLSGRDAKKVLPTILTKLDDVRWSVRVAVIRAIENTPAKEGIDALVKRMVKEDGRLIDDCARAMRALTGQNLSAVAEVWRIWWESNREKWTEKPAAADPSKPPAPYAPPPADVVRDAKKTGFFGLVIESKRVVFVIDISGSMNDSAGATGPDAKLSRADMAKRELRQAISNLAEGTLFDLVFYSGSVRVWKPELQKMDTKIRKEAVDFVDGVVVVGGTATYDALEAAYSIGDIGKLRKRDSDPTGEGRMDTIVLLSDGKPTVGRVIDPDQIRAAIREINKTRRVMIHAIAFGGDADQKFMRGLADDTGGTYLLR